MQPLRCVNLHWVMFFSFFFSPLLGPLDEIISAKPFISMFNLWRDDKAVLIELYGIRASFIMSSSFEAWPLVYTLQSLLLSVFFFFPRFETKKSNRAIILHIVVRLLLNISRFGFMLFDMNYDHLTWSLRHYASSQP